MQKSEKFLYLTFLMLSSSSWWVKSSWLNFQSSRVASSWKYAQLNLSWVENMNNSTLNWVKFNLMISLQRCISHSWCYVLNCNFTDSTFNVDYFQLFSKKVILVDLQLILHSWQSIIYILQWIFKQRWIQ